jgi:hypothetical protein
MHRVCEDKDINICDNLKWAGRAGGYWLPPIINTFKFTQELFLAKKERIIALI